MPPKPLFASTGLLPLCVGGALALAGCASTTTSPSTDQPGLIGYVTDGSGNVVRSGGGGCVRTGFWQPQYATKECDPDLYAQAHPAPPPTAQAEPQPAAPAAAPVAAAAPPPPVRVYVGADAYFGFNRAELTPDDKRKLDIVANRAKNGEDASVRVVGYADQIGSDDYNLSLSQRRADAVRTYLVEQGIPENAVNVDARGEADPIVRCEGRQGASLIDCLQPNRRTEVEVSALEAP